MSAARYADRTDTVSDKLRLLAAAQAEGRLDVAMSFWILVGPLPAAHTSSAGRDAAA